MAAVSSFGNTNMAAVTSHENSLCTGKQVRKTFNKQNFKGAAVLPKGQTTISHFRYNKIHLDNEAWRTQTKEIIKHVLLFSFVFVL